jgi:hypothetical protein
MLNNGDNEHGGRRFDQAWITTLADRRSASIGIVKIADGIRMADDAGKDVGSGNRHGHRVDGES